MYLAVAVDRLLRVNDMFSYKSFTSVVKIGVELLLLCWVKD